MRFSMMLGLFRLQRMLLMMMLSLSSVSVMVLVVMLITAIRTMVIWFVAMVVSFCTTVRVIVTV